MAGGLRGTALRLFQGLAPTYDRTVDWATLFQDRYWKRWVSEQAPDKGWGLALDIGCGTLVLEERLSQGEGSFVGLDLTAEMLRVGQAKSLSNVALLARGDAEELPFPDETFDSVVSCYVPKYVATERFADEVARVAKPGATVALYDFVRPRGLLSPFLELYIRAGLRAVGALLAALGRSSAFTFEKLPQIVDGSLWDAGIVEAMETRGLRTLAAKRLTGGVVFAYCGRKMKGL